MFTVDLVTFPNLTKIDEITQSHTQTTHSIVNISKFFLTSQTLEKTVIHTFWNLETYFEILKT